MDEERKLQVDKAAPSPRRAAARNKEVPVPAYQAVRQEHRHRATHVLEIC